MVMYNTVCLVQQLKHENLSMYDLKYFVIRTSSKNTKWRIVGTSDKDNDETETNTDAVTR